MKTEVILWPQVVATWTPLITQQLFEATKRLDQMQRYDVCTIKYFLLKIWIWICRLTVMETSEQTQ